MHVPYGDDQQTMNLSLRNINNAQLYILKHTHELYIFYYSHITYNIRAPRRIKLAWNVNVYGIQLQISMEQIYKGT
jgi:hypothetical protein